MTASTETPARLARDLIPKETQNLLPSLLAPATSGQSTSVCDWMATHPPMQSQSDRYTENLSPGPQNCILIPGSVNILQGETQFRLRVE